jgi:hypothetical protein
MNFEKALELIKGGAALTRAGWVNAHVYLERAALLCDAGQKCEPCLVLFTHKGSNATYQPGWLPSQADLFAEDWSTVT